MGIYVWGTGCGASELIERGLAPDRIAAFVESCPDAPVFLGRPVLTPEEVDVSDCDLMIVTTRHVEPIAGKCANLGIPADRCLYLKNSVSLRDRNAVSRDAVLGGLGGELAEKLRSSPAAVKRHLKLLEDAGLIRRTRTEGNIASYIYLNLPAGSKSEPPQDQKSATDGAKMIPRAAQKRATSNPRKQPELTTQYYQHGEDESL